MIMIQLFRTLIAGLFLAIGVDAQANATQPPSQSSSARSVVHQAKQGAVTSEDGQTSGNRAGVNSSSSSNGEKSGGENGSSSAGQSPSGTAQLTYDELMVSRVSRVSDALNTAGFFDAIEITVDGLADWARNPKNDAQALLL